MLVNDPWFSAAPSDFWEVPPALPGNWDSVAISIHSHWLSEAEADAHWMTYACIKSKSDSKWSEFIEKENAFVALFRVLSVEYELTLWDVGERYEDTLPETNDIEVLCRRNVREQQFDLFRSEKLKLVIIGNFDLTFPVFTPHGGGWSKLESLVRSVGLYVLT